jgi:hypothetical protein
MVAAMENISSTHHIPVNALAGQMALSYDSLMRWKRRIRNGLDPVSTPGPKKVEPLNLKSLKADIQLLKHARKRTHSTGALYQQYRMQVSRRQLNTMVIEARREHHRQESDRMQRIEWHQPDLAWAIDGSEVDTVNNLTVYRVQDLASQYKFPPVAWSDQPCGEEISGHLERLFRTFAVPLFLKRDNDHAVNEILEQHLVIPLNSPAYYAPYNGAIEHTQGELNRYLHDWSWKAESPDNRTLLTELSCHDHNHLPRRSLKGKNSCRAYFDGPRVTFDKRQRKEVFLWIKQAASDMLEKLGDDGMVMTAWRIAARTWLHQNHYITIVRNGKVLPYYSSNFCHN